MGTRYLCKECNRKNNKPIKQQILNHKKDALDGIQRSSISGFCICINHAEPEIREICEGLLLANKEREIINLEIKITWGKKKKKTLFNYKNTKTITL